MIHFNPIAWEVRLYDDTKDAQEHYDNRDDWEASMLVRRFGNVLYVSMLQDRFSRKLMRQVQDWARMQGITAIEWDGNGKTQHLEV